MTVPLTTRLRHLRLSGMVEALPGRVAQAEAAPLAHREFLELLVDDEFVRRADRLFARRLKQAGIVTIQTLADFDWHFNPKLPKATLVALASARFVQSHGGVLLICPPGVGKSHVATALAVGAIRAGTGHSSAARLISRRISHRPTRRGRGANSCSSSRGSISSCWRISA